MRRILRPVLQPLVFINHDRYTLAVQTISTVSAGPGNPDLLAGLNVIEVGLESAASESPESSAAIIESLPQPGHLDASDSRRTRETVGFVLDVHDAGFHRHQPCQNPLPNAPRLSCGAYP